ncbi:MAG: VWA domain-containing protein [Aristaeellaceae bacterium]
MGVTIASKVLSTSAIACGESFQVTLALTAEPNIVTNPVDIVLILDRSRSMAGSPLSNLKAGAKAFIDIIAASTGGPAGQIGSGSRIGVVSFSDEATQDTALITSVDTLQNAVDALTAGGLTNHADAFTKAMQLFSATSLNRKVMVMFTDGNTTVGGDASPIAAAARAQGVTIYAIGLSGNGGVDEDALEDWASKPASAYVAITPNDEELKDLFENLAENITKPGATNIEITDYINPCFRITSVDAPTKGTASLLDSTTVRWRMTELGVSGSEGATLNFTVQHTGNCSGTLEVNESIDYSDDEDSTVTFPSPELTVNCGISVLPESCPTPVNVTIGGCTDTVEFDAGTLMMESLGRILQLSVTLLRVCPNRRVALAVILTEVDSAGVEHQRGLKMVTVPAHTQPSCANVTVRCIKFVLPQSLDVTATSTGNLCGIRQLRARFIANYVDYDFACCTSDT